MAKKSQTTGTPDKRRKSTDAAPVVRSGFAGYVDRLLGNPQSRHDREDALNRLLQRAIVVSAAIIIGLIAIALITDQIIVPNQAVATVNGESITVRDFRDRVRFERARILLEASQRQAFAETQAQSFGIDVNQLLQNDQLYLTYVNELNFPDQLGRRVLDDIVADRLVEQKARELNISVDSERVQESLNDYFGYDPTAVAAIGLEPTATLTPTITPTPFVSPTPAPTLTPTATPSPTPEVTAEATAETEATEEPLFPTPIPSPTRTVEEIQTSFNDNVQSFRNEIRRQSGLGEDAVNAYFERRARREAVQKALSEGQDQALFVNARHILVETLESAEDIIAALNAGESFAQLAAASSTDTGSGTRGGELGWANVDQYVEEFADAVREAPIGEIVGPVESQFGFHIIQVRAREERTLEGQDLEQQQQRIFEEWLADQRESQSENIEIYNNWPDYVPR